MATDWIQQADAQLGTLLADWGIVTTILALVVAGLLAYPIIYSNESDTHPMLLARQSTASPVRNKNESAVYRSPETPYGYPLKTGLNVKVAGAPRWTQGKDGDLRDIWREVLKGGTKGDDGKDIPKSSIFTVMGRDETIDHKIENLTVEIKIFGQYLNLHHVKSVAIYLPNSVEYLSTIFACAFYGMNIVLLPYNQPHPKVYEFINVTGAHALICAAGTLPLDGLAESCKNLRLLTWVVEKSSRHMDWYGVPDFAADRLEVRVWHDIMDDHKSTAKSELPENTEDRNMGDIVAVWQAVGPNGKAEIANFTQRNIVAATAALLSALPLRQRFMPSDLLLPADSFNHTYVLCQTLAALFAHSSIAISSVAGPGVDLALASRGVSPTVIVASAESMANLYKKYNETTLSIPQKLSKYYANVALAAGRMPVDGVFSKYLAPPSNAELGTEPGKLRLILTSDRLGAGSPPLTSSMLSDLRIFTRARICYALTTANVAGAVAQTSVFDYRREDSEDQCHFGVPLSSVEIKLAHRDDGQVGAPQPQGEFVVSGPAVSGGEVRLGVQGKVREDQTIAYA